jgi:hypothetical protein
MTFHLRKRQCGRRNMPSELTTVVPFVFLMLGVTILFSVTVFFASYKSVQEQGVLFSDIISNIDTKSVPSGEVSGRLLHDTLYEDDVLIFSSPPVAVCQSSFMTSPFACIWYPVVLKWYKLISAIPRYYVYHYTLGQGFSTANIGLYPTTNFPTLTRPWDYFQSLFLMVLPAIIIGFLSIIFGILFWFCCSITCCCCCCGAGLGANKRSYGSAVQTTARVMMVIVVVVVGLGIFLELNGYILWKQAIQSFFDLLASEIAFAKGKANDIQAESAKMDNNYTSSAVPSEIGLINDIFDQANVYVSRAKSISMCSSEVPLLVATNVGSFSYTQYYTVAYNWLLYNFGCIDLWWLLFLVCIQVVVAFVVMLGLLGSVFKKPMPSLCMAWLVFLGVILAMLLLIVLFPLSILISDTCTELDALEAGVGSNAYLNAINPPKFIVDCTLQGYLDTIDAFITSSLATSRQASADAQAVIDSSSSSEAAKAEARSALSAADATTDALENMAGFILDFLSCEHWKQVYNALKGLLCFSVLNAIVAHWNGAAIIALGLIPGWFIAMFVFYVVRKGSNDKAGESEEAEMQAMDEDGGDDGGKDADDGDDENEDDD